MRLTARLIGVLLLASSAAQVAAGLDEPFPGNPAKERAREIFRKRVRPALQTKCLGCHGDGEELEGALDLRDREAMLRGGKSGPALVPGKSLESLIYQSLRRDDERVMPPKDKDQLSREEIDAFKTWIDGGAPWPSESGEKG
jgi:mono/diheme cytochrome c family protein